MFEAVIFVHTRIRVEQFSAIPALGTNSIHTSSVDHRRRRLVWRCNIGSPRHRAYIP